MSGALLFMALLSHRISSGIVHRTVVGCAMSGDNLSFAGLSAWLPSPTAGCCRCLRVASLTTLTGVHSHH